MCPSLLLTLCVGAPPAVEYTPGAPPPVVTYTPGGTAWAPLKVTPPKADPMPGFEWRELPGVGWGWVQKGLAITPARTPVQIPPGVSSGSPCPGGVCPPVAPRRFP